jgi:hypothetical protein
VIAQIGIAVFGLVAIALTQAPDVDLHRYASIAGLMAQPFWFYVTWRARQWGMFALSLAYAGIWVLGFWAYWISGIAT